VETSPERLSTEQILSAVSHLSLPELEQVFARVLALQAERKAAHLSTVESALLVRINQGLPLALRERIVMLRAKREDESITDTEYEELTSSLTERKSCTPIVWRRWSNLPGYMASVCPCCWSGSVFIFLFPQPFCLLCSDLHFFCGMLTSDFLPQTSALVTHYLFQSRLAQSGQMALQQRWVFNRLSLSVNL
jgi:hypothetical protein